MNPLATSKEDILAASRELIKKNGWTAVSIRAVAARCSVSPGTIYNYFESKAELVGATIESVWYEIFFHPKNDLIFHSAVDCVTWIFERLEYGNQQFPGFFSFHSLGFMHDEKEKGKKLMMKTWGHILNGICAVLREDPNVRKDAFDEEFTVKEFADILFSLILVAIIRQDYNPSNILKLIKKTLY